VKAKHVKAYKISPHADCPPRGQLLLLRISDRRAWRRIGVAREFLASTLGLHEIAYNYDVFMLTSRKYPHCQIQIAAFLAAPDPLPRMCPGSSRRCVNNANYTFHYRSACFSFYRDLSDRSRINQMDSIRRALAPSLPLSLFLSLFLSLSLSLSASDVTERASAGEKRG